MATPTTHRQSYALLLSLGLIFCLSIASPPSYPMPLPCTGNGCDDITVSIQDFNVIQHKNRTFFRVSKCNTTGAGLSLASAPAIDGPWVPRQHIHGPEVYLLSPVVEKNPSNTHLWTPELHYIDSKYYLYYSVFNNESKPGFDICVATSPVLAITQGPTMTASAFLHPQRHILGQRSTKTS